MLITRKNRFKGLLAVVLLLILVSSNTLTMFAANKTDAGVSTVEFVGLDGTEYQVGTTSNSTFQSSLYADSVTTSLLTEQHNWVSGYYIVHTKYSDGSCIRKVWNAQICSICQNVIVGTLYSSTWYAVCPH